MTPDRLPDLLSRMSAAEIEAHQELAELARLWQLRQRQTLADVYRIGHAQLLPSVRTGRP